jgi:hypothetical protein
MGIMKCVFAKSGGRVVIGLRGLKDPKNGE